MKEIRTEIIINAAPDKVWAVLTDFESYPDWNPFIKSISGPKKSGETLAMTAQLPDGMSMNFKPLVLNFDENKEFRWIGVLLFKGLFDGEHYFILSANDDGTTTFVHGELFRGILVGLFSKMLLKTEQGFLLMNEAMKKKCEK